MNLPLIPQDKANHFIYGFIIFIISTLFFSNLVSLGIVLVIASFKEFYDLKYGGNPEILDIIASIMAGIILLLKELIN